MTWFTGFRDPSRSGSRRWNPCARRLRKVCLMHLNKDFKEFAELLNANGVEYLIVGGYALMVHGYPRYTGDIDFWVNPSRDNIHALLKSLEQFGFASVGLTEQDFNMPDSVIQLGYPPARIDLMTSIDAVDFDTAFPMRVNVTIDGVDLGFISRADLIKNKSSTGRLKDMADVQALDADSGTSQ